MEIIPATREQIARFKVAAAQRYTARGVKPELANTLFEMQMGKMASELGVELKSAKCGSKHTANKKPKAKKKLSKKAELLAGQICKALGRERKSE